MLDSILQQSGTLQDLMKDSNDAVIELPPAIASRDFERLIDAMQNANGLLPESLEDCLSLMQTAHYLDVESVMGRILPHLAKLMIGMEPDDFRRFEGDDETLAIAEFEKYK